MDDLENSEVVFETWLFKLRGDFGAKRMSHYLSGAWSKKYFVLLRVQNKPRIFYYNKQPKNSLSCPKGMIDLDEHYHVDKKSACKGKEFVCQLITTTKSFTLAVEKEHIYDLLLFFLRTQIRLKDELEGECFVVRPEKSEDHRKIGSQTAMCLLHVSQWGLTLALQLSKCVLVQWPLRYIRWYECTGRGRFTIETGNQSSTGRGVYIFKTRVGQDSVMYDKIDEFVNEQAKLQGMVQARVSNASNSMEAYMTDYSGLHILTLVSSDVRFVSHLKKIARDIYDHLNEHLGGRAASSVNVMTSSTSVDRLIDDRDHRQLSSSSSSFMTVPQLRVVQNHSPSNDGHQSEFSSSQRGGRGTPGRGGNNISIPSQYLHMGSPMFDMSPLTDQPPSLRNFPGSGITSPASATTTKVDYSLEQFVKPPGSSFYSSEDWRSSRNAGEKKNASSWKEVKHLSYSSRSGLRSLSFDDLSAYVADSDADRKDRVQKGGEPVARDDASYPYSYATTPDFSLLIGSQRASAAKEAERRKVEDDNDGYCRARDDRMSRTFSNPNLSEYDRHDRVLAFNRVGLNASVSRPLGAAAEAGKRSNVTNVSSLAVATDVESAEAPPPPAAMIKGVSSTKKTRVFTKQKSTLASGGSPVTSNAVAASLLASTSLSSSSNVEENISLSSSATTKNYPHFPPPLMSFNQKHDKNQRQLPDLPDSKTSSSLAHDRSKDATSFC